MRTEIHWGTAAWLAVFAAAIWFKFGWVWAVIAVSGSFVFMPYHPRA